MTEHGKEYEDRAEYKLRYGVYRDNMKKVQFLRETDQGTAEYGATVFADMTESEFKQHLGLTPVWKKRSLSEDPISWPAADIPDVELPREFDWRDHNAVTEVKNPGTVRLLLGLLCHGKRGGSLRRQTRPAARPVRAGAGGLRHPG